MVPARTDIHSRPGRDFRTCAGVDLCSTSGGVLTDNGSVAMTLSALRDLAVTNETGPTGQSHWPSMIESTPHRRYRVELVLAGRGCMLWILHP